MSEFLNGFVFKLGFSSPFTFFICAYLILGLFSQNSSLHKEKERLEDKIDRMELKALFGGDDDDDDYDELDYC